MRVTRSNGTQDNSQRGMHVASLSNMCYKKSIFEADLFLFVCFTAYYGSLGKGEKGKTIKIQVKWEWGGIRDRKENLKLSW